MLFTVRAAGPLDLPVLAGIELSGDEMFARIGIVLPAGPATVDEAIERGADVWVVDDPPVAFAAVTVLDGRPYLEQISVRADQVRRGIGGVLLADVVRRYGPGLILITFRDVPWNGPWYLRHGFADLPEAAWGPQLREYWQAEADAGLQDLGPRVVLHYPGVSARAPAGP